MQGLFSFTTGSKINKIFPVSVLKILFLRVDIEKITVVLTLYY